MIEQRRHTRSPMNQQITFVQKGATEAREGLATDISLGGMFIQTTNPAPFNAEVTVRTRLPGSADEHVLPGVVRWMRPDGMGVQFGLLGARETHLITEIARKHEEQEQKR
jgi:type IV pilus assembly protein PilZ